MKSVLNKIVPNREERRVLKKASRHMVKKINKKLKKARAVVGGSIAKKTFLKGDYDIDIFVQFDKKYYKNKDISKVLHSRLKALFPETSKISGLHKIHGSRDYFQILQDPFTFEIVPIYKIKKAEDAENITDISPLHTKWVRKKAKRKIDEIRLTKAFCKANNLYGAESYIRGFSGYTLEILTAHYKSFQSLIQAASRWKKGEKIDPEKHGVSKLNKSKISPLIVIDPVQDDRNTAASLSEKRFNEFVDLAKAFLRNPSPDYFKKKEFDLEKIKSASILRIVPLKGKEDVVGSKLIKCSEYIHQKLKKEGYLVKSHDWNWDNKEVYFWYFVKTKDLPKEKKHFGPPTKEKAHLREFKKKYSRYPLKKQGSRTYVILKRKHTNVNHFLKHLIESDMYIKEKVKEIKILI
ncbi:MAG: CCA tRNA nucleotidyltransferase [Nanoarchaeota archaeon]|jgi:tRNA nucleotidyltransferase (CCA-adding enzyme)|nr:CCA tRNA nucleotidyltransferase [Nanoarchaeota archaeon]|tara:strand:+ start:17150 stop:18373 length:1224 start_codon:yes stop_codon:yes gene_type:complete